MKKFASLFFLVGLILLTQSFAVESVNVEIPTFGTEINTVDYDNTKADYPLIVYKDITYFPLTYTMSRELGLITGWDNEKGLFISNYCVSFETPTTDNQNANNKYHTKYIATIPTYPITLNGIKIDNSKEEYPLLNFRGVTYFPMTWEFAHNEFGWFISWNNVTGLKVDPASTDILPLFVREVNDDYAVLQSYETIYDSSINENGDIVYETTGVENIYNYRLDYATGTAEKIPNADKIKEYVKDDLSVDVSDKFEINSGKILYEGKEILDLKEIEFENGKKVRAQAWNFEDASFISITVVNTDIPAPYSPVKYAVLRCPNGGNPEIMKGWNATVELENAYELSNGYYLCSNHTYLGDRWNSGCGTITFVDKDGKTENVNDKYEDYGSLICFGSYNDSLYVLATWHPKKDRLGYDEVSAVNDGFFYLNTDGKLTKIFDFIDGETFMTKDGGLYCIRRLVSEVVDLVNGKRIIVK